MFELFCSNCGVKINRKIRKRDFENKHHFCCKECEKQFRTGKLTHLPKQNEIILKEDYAIIKIKNNIKGKLDCFIDIDNIDKIKDYHWNIRIDKRHPNCTYYVETRKKINGKSTRIHLHRLILECPNGYVIDHINGNGLDNRKCNLRIITQKQNCLNKNHKEDCRVTYSNRDRIWIVMLQGKYMGRYRTKEKALVRSNYIKELIKEGEWEKLKTLNCEKIEKLNIIK